MFYHAMLEQLIANYAMQMYSPLFITVSSSYFPIVQFSAWIFEAITDIDITDLIEIYWLKSILYKDIISNIFFVRTSQFVCFKKYGHNVCHKVFSAGQM